MLMSDAIAPPHSSSLLLLTPPPPPHSTTAKIRIDRPLYYYYHSYQHLEPHIYQMQHGFIRGKSTTTQLLEVYHEILESVASGNEVDAIYLDFSKAFDKVPHHLLLIKLETLGIRASLLSLFQSYLTDRQQESFFTVFALNGFP